MFGRKKTTSDGKIGSYTLKHVQGLDNPNTSCSVSLYPDKLIIVGSDKEYTLNIDKIVSVNFEIEVDAKKYSKSSLIGGIVGAAAFGTVGAVIGSAPKVKEDRAVTNCVVIGYTLSDGDTGYLIFQNIYPNDPQAAKFTDKLRPLIKSRPSQSIDL